MKFPLLFLNHGGGPLPLMGRQPSIVNHIKSVRELYLPKTPPKLIVVISAHWEENPIRISSSPNPEIHFDYQGFPSETYRYDYPAPGSPAFANKIKELLDKAGIPSGLDEKRGFDHGVFIPLMILYPDANIPTVCVSIHGSLDAKANIDLGRALAPLLDNDDDDDVLIIGSGYTFHNMQAFFHPSDATYQASVHFNEWLKDTLLAVDSSSDAGKESNSQEMSSYIGKLLDWEQAPGARVCHPRAEHFMPLLVVAGAAYESSMNVPQLIYDTSGSSESYSDEKKTTPVLDRHAVSGYLFSAAL